jgi:large repetitive protein
MQIRHVLSVLAVAVVLGAGGTPVRAQNVDLQHFEPSSTTNGLVTVKGGAAEAWFVPTASMALTYMHEPLVAIDRDGNELGTLVSHRLDAILGFSLGLTPPSGVRLGIIRGFDVGLLVPVVPLQVGKTTTNGIYSGTGATKGGIGDPRLEGRLTLLTRDPFGVDVALVPVLSFPGAAGSKYFGSGSVTFTPEVAVSTVRGPVFLGANLGWRVRGNKQLFGMEISDQLLWRAGTGLDLHAFGAPENLGAAVELYGLARGVRPFRNSKQSPTEVLVSGRYRVRDFLVTAGLGTGISRGYGAPDLRLLTALAWAPRAAPVEPEPPTPPPPPPPRPTCPDGSEARVNADGTSACPEVVNDADHDGIADDIDRCPGEPEDKDGFEDTDGCPDLDNDSDGIADADDKCPDVAEDLEGFEDQDGCPDAERDTDGDGVPDYLDKCPMEPEDKDGFQDEDGCPDYDNDLDGIADADDKCPNEPETINGVEDEDGCPDKGATLVKLTAEKIEIKEAVYFDTNSDVIQARSFNLLDQVAAVLRNHTNITKIRVEGHTDSQGAEDYNLDLSQRRANSVRVYLIGKQIAQERVEAVGFGVTKPIASNATKRGREQNRRVEFVIVEQGN